MEWVDDAIVLGARHFGEGKLVAEVFSREHGRFGGVVHAGRKSQPILQSGNLVHAGWKARLADQLGFYGQRQTVEPHATRLLDDAIALAGLSSAVSLIRSHRGAEAYPQLYDALIVLIEAMPHTDILACALYALRTGAAGCAWLRPRSDPLRGDWRDPDGLGEPAHRARRHRRSGRAAQDVLLRLPPFLVDADAELVSGDVADAFAAVGLLPGAARVRPSRRRHAAGAGAAD
ncbi:MAG: recombination protein O N-terminal domain-containing protein [Hyphomonadaceae bacterium]